MSKNFDVKFKSWKKDSRDSKCPFYVWFKELLILWHISVLLNTLFEYLKSWKFMTIWLTPKYSSLLILNRYSIIVYEVQTCFSLMKNMRKNIKYFITCITFVLLKIFPMMSCWYATHFNKLMNFIKIDHLRVQKDKGAIIWMVFW